MTFWFLSSSSLRRVNKELRSRNFMDSKEEEKINKINTKQEKKKKMNKTHTGTKETTTPAAAAAAAKPSLNEEREKKSIRKRWRRE